MSQFGVTGKNPPWVRNTGAGISGTTAQLLVQAAAQAGATPTAVAQQATAYNAGMATLRLAQVGLDQPCRDNVFLVQNASLQPGTVLSQPGIALPTTLSTGSVATVSYPTPRSLHPSQSSQFSSSAQPAIQSGQQQQHSQVKQRVFTGTVSKLHDNFGFVDDDVFFQITCVKGAMPKVGDRVLVEASYNPNMPFKWNAARIQLLPNQVQAPSSQSQQTLGLRSSMLSSSVVASNMATAVLNPQIAIALAAAASAQSVNPMSTNLTLSTQSYNQVPPPSQVVIHAMGGGTSNMNRLPSLMSTRRHSPPPAPLPPPTPSSSMRREREREIRRVDDRRDRERHREHERERVPVVRKRSRSPRPRSRSPPRRRARIAPRYTVQVPKLSLDLKEANVLELRKRYANMYVPSDFFFSSFVWMDAFPLHRPFVSERPCHFHVVSKEVDRICENDAVLDPPDADHSFCAKVMLMSAPLLDELYQKCGGSMSADESGTGESFVHPTRLFSFLVGLKNKNETIAIGGPWSPSLDGADPRGDPSVLIRTAVRTCKGLTGIDLAVCTKWYRFAEIYYHRRGGESSSSNKSRSSGGVAMSSSSAGSASASCATATARVETVVIFLPDVWNCNPTLAEWDAITCSYQKQLLQKRLPVGAIVTATAEDNALLADSKDNQVTDESLAKDAIKKDPSHHSDLDPKSMKIAGLRQELGFRNLSSKGLKSQLVARLTKALKLEHEKEEEETEAAMEDEDPSVNEDKTETDEKESEIKAAEDAERQLQQHRSSEEEREQEARDKRNYMFPDTPSLIVHPSRTAKGGRFDCTVMSLSVLLDYRPEDNKEYSFEVSLFAELFNEMLVRDYGFRIYRAIVDAPERKDVANNGAAAAAAVIKNKRKEKKEEKKQDSKDDSIKRDDKKKKDEDDKDAEAEDEEDENDEEIDENQEQDEEETREKKKDENRRRDSKEKKSSAHKSSSSSSSIDPSLLLACVYFDQNHCDYILDKDMEDILATLGLNLSRAQTRRLLQNVLVKDRLLYRKLSGGSRSKDVEQENQSSKDGNENKDSTDDPVSSVEEQAAGNKGLLQRTRGGTGGSNPDWGVSTIGGPPTVPEEGLVVYNGALLDINKLLQQLHRIESARACVEIAMKDAQEQLVEIKDHATGVQETNAKTATELREVKRRLRNAEEELEVQRERSREYIGLIRKCHDIIQPAIVRSSSADDADDRRHRPDEDGECDKPETVPIKPEVLQNGDP